MNFKLTTIISIITAYIFCSALVLLLGARQLFAEQGKSYVLGEISDKTISEGEFLTFTIEAPDSFGSDVTWTATSPDLTEKEVEGIFYDIPAFPGAEGFGARTSGGRGGRVVKVTNLNRDGHGSLKEALLVKEPRIIVFDVSGVINAPLLPSEWTVGKSARLYAANAPLTIAGQTAPGAGITINAQLLFTDGDGGVASDNAILRFLRIRNPYHRPGLGDNISFIGNRGILDHISAAWGNDENFDLTHLKNGTIQWCGIEEAAGYGAPWEVYIDKDADGMLDCWEVKVRSYSASDAITDYVLHIKPDEDLDGDGATNLEEYNNGTNPLVANAPSDPEWIVNYDSDNDGLADWWEQKAIDASGTDGLTSLADIRSEDDLDGDLSTNLEEHNTGTDPLSKPGHNFGMIMGYSGKDISLHHNFFAHHQIRTPLSGVEVLDHRNNVIYNAGLGITWHPADMNNQRPGEFFKTNIVGNFFKPGPSDPKTQDIPIYFRPFICGQSMIYGDGNYFDMIDEPHGYLDMFDPNIRRGVATVGLEQKIDTMYPVPDVTTHTAEEAYGLVTAHSGSLPRDAVTSRNIEEIKTRTGKWGKEMPAGGLMEGLTPVAPKKDSDNDGMPDEWETAVINVQGKTVNRGAILDPAVQDHNTIVKAGESVLMYNGQPVAGTENRYKGLTYIEYYINELADQLILKELIEAGYDQTDLPGYGKRPAPTFSWTPGYEQAREYDITFTASDGTNTASQTVKVSVANINRKPVISHVLIEDNGARFDGFKTIEPGEGFNFEFYVKDPDSDSYTVTLDNKPDGAIITSMGRTRSDLQGGGIFDIYKFEWYPTLNDVNWDKTTSIVATDILGGIIRKDFRVTVNEPSNPVHTITAQAGEGGRIDPRSGEILAQEGENITFFMHANVDYVLSDVIVDGASVGAKGECAFNNVSGDHAIKAIFEHQPGVVSGLIMHLAFDGDMQDSSVFSNHGTADDENAPTLAIDRFGNADSAYDFDGVNDYIRIQDNDLFDSFGYTITAWVYARKDLYSHQSIVSKSARDGINSVGLYVICDFILTSGSGYPRSHCVLEDQENRWMHLAISRSEKGYANFYLNGENVGQEDADLNSATDLDLIVGARNADAPSSFFDGIIDDVRIYNKALSADEIAAFVESELRMVTTSTSLPNGTVNQDYSYPVSVAGGSPPYQWNYTDMPDWLSANVLNETTQTISGIPPQAGSFSVAVQIEDSAGATIAKQFTLEVKEHTDSDSITITTQMLPEAIVGSEYIASLNASSGGSQPYVWSIDSNDLPPGLYLDGDNILGIPEETRLYEFIVTVTDGSQKAAKNLCIKVTISDTDVPDTDIPDIEVYEINCDFGSVNIGNSADWTFVIFNKGVAALIIHSISSDNQVFSIASPFFPAEIASGETLNVSVRFTPQTEDEICGTLVINSNDPDEEEITISMVGTGEKSVNTDANDTSVITVTLRNNISDTTLHGSTEERKDKNLGGMGELNIWSNGVIKTLLRPDFSQGLADAVIEKVELKLYCYSLYWLSQNPKLEVYRVTHNWEEGEGIWYKDTDGGATWNEYDRDPVEINEWSTPGGDIDTITDFGYGPNGIVSEALMQKDSWITFDITDLAQEWISNEMENYGILIQAIDRGCNAAKFYSSEYKDENLRPVLVVSYSDGSTEALDIHSELSQGTQSVDYEASILASGGNLPYQWSIQGLPAGLDWRYLDDTAITIYGIPTESGEFSLEVTLEDNNAQTLTTYLALTIINPNLDTVTLRDNISDTTLHGSTEERKDKNLGGMGELNIWSNGVIKTLLRPDFSQGLADAVIEKVELKLYCYSLYWLSQNPKLEVYRVTHNWEEGVGIWYTDTDGGATWNEYDREPLEINEWSTPGGDIDTITDFGYGSNGIVSEAVMQEESWVTFDITELAQKWIFNEMENYGILIQAIDRGCNAAKFYSSEYEDENLRPVLVMSYKTLNIHSELSQGTQDTDYEASISATGGNLPYQWSIQGLPAGLNWSYLDDTAIKIYGIPTESGQFSFEVTVEDNNAQTLTTYLALTIVEPDTDTDTLRDSISDTTLDGYSEERKDKNLGGMGDLNIWSNGVQKILLRSDLSQIPANAVIEKVELRLYCYSHDWPSYDPRLEVYRITHDWEEGEGIWYTYTGGGATWNEYDRDPLEINEWGTPGGDIDTITDFGYGPNGIVSEAVMQKDSWVTFDITELAQKWIFNEMENYGILIQAIDRGCNAAKFYSSEYEDENLRPDLTIKYLP